MADGAGDLALLFEREDVFAFVDGKRFFGVDVDLAETEVESELLTAGSIARALGIHFERREVHIDVLSFATRACIGADHIELALEKLALGFDRRRLGARRRQAAPVHGDIGFLRLVGTILGRGEGAGGQAFDRDGLGTIDERRVPELSPVVPAPALDVAVVHGSTREVHPDVHVYGLVQLDDRGFLRVAAFEFSSTHLPAVVVAPALHVASMGHHALVVACAHQRGIGQVALFADRLLLAPALDLLVRRDRAGIAIARARSDRDHPREAFDFLGRLFGADVTPTGDRAVFEQCASMVLPRGECLGFRDTRDLGQSLVRGPRVAVTDRVESGAAPCGDGAVGEHGVLRTAAQSEVLGALELRNLFGCARPLLAVDLGFVRATSPARDRSGLRSHAHHVARAARVATHPNIGRALDAWNRDGRGGVDVRGLDSVFAFVVTTPTAGGAIVHQCTRSTISSGNLNGFEGARTRPAFVSMGGTLTRLVCGFLRGFGALALIGVAGGGEQEQGNGGQCVSKSAHRFARSMLGRVDLLTFVDEENDQPVDSTLALSSSIDAHASRYSTKSFRSLRRR